MVEKQIIPVDQLVLSADAALDDVVRHWQGLEPESLLNIGDRLNEIHKRLQLLIGAWLFVYSDTLGYRDIKALAERWDRKENTLSQWKSVYKRTRNLYHDTDCPRLEFGKMQQIARIPAEHQADWVTPATEMKRDDLRAAISAAKKSEDWTPPFIIESPAADTASEVPPLDVGTVDPDNDVLAADSAQDVATGPENGAVPVSGNLPDEISELPVADLSSDGAPTDDETDSAESDSELSTPQEIPDVILETAREVMVGFVEAQPDKYVARLEVSSSEWMTITDDSLSNELERELLTSAAAMCLWHEWMFWYQGGRTSAFTDAIGKIGPVFVRGHS
ncbi:MAG: hypothetical protein OXG78_15825 [Chloroflexi bacterium]|nr:hypothetical protein [Chloroflexota bacterium]